MNLENISDMCGWKEIPRGESVEEVHLVKMQINGKRIEVFPVYIDGKNLDLDETEIYLKQNGKIFEMESGKEEFIEKYHSKILKETDKQNGN